jgi:hypothetical protein
MGSKIMEVFPINKKEFLKLFGIHLKKDLNRSRRTNVLI